MYDGSGAVVRGDEINYSAWAHPRIPFVGPGYSVLHVFHKKLSERVRDKLHSVLFYTFL